MDNPTTSLLYDDDLTVFKVVLPNGNIFASFSPNQVTSVSHAKTDTLFKEHMLHVGTKFANGDEFTFRFYTGCPEQALKVEGWVL